MKRTTVNTKLIDTYLDLLKNLSLDNKLDLISKLMLSLKSDINKKKNAIDKSFGAWEGDEKVEDLIKSIRESRPFNRNREEL